MKTLYWLDIRKMLEGLGFVREPDPKGTGMQWSQKGIPFSCQGWDEAPREFHWRTLECAINVARAISTKKENP